ncbi:Zn-dependent hydrolase [Acidocella sp.]|uniref:Zn-dependent hydrolase n=1 Tax=Acidocella sp. TaxID=50710 RepID=UPI003D03B906
MLTRFAAIGATPGGGVTRLCASPEDGRARDLFRETAGVAGAGVRTDAAGNQFARFPLTGDSCAPLVMMGSHLDSQSRAGRFDGTLGVATALRVGAALMRARAAGARFNADFVAVNWTNEEGARFRPSLLGSGVYSGAFTADYALSRRDDNDISLGEALAGIGYLGSAAPPPLPACYLELHVEQGSRLEEAGASIGVVGRNWGAIKIDARFLGEQAHTGPTLMERRRDALLGASYAIAGLREVAARWPGRVHSSVARIRVEPNSANVVPALVTIAVEIRAGDNALLREAGEAAEAVLAQAAARANVTHDIATRTEREVRALPDAPAALVRRCADEAGLRRLDMDTVAGHDALSLLGLCPVGLVFVPSIGGITHNEAEDTAPEDLAAGLTLCTMAAARLCRAGGAPEAALDQED